jgi:hypothetical protein
MFRKVEMNAQYRRLESAVYALLWFARDPTPDKLDCPNPLQVTARVHREILKINAAWYDVFASVLVETTTELDAVCVDEAEIFIDSAWRTAIDPGIRYMKRHGAVRRRGDRG